jgi:hypothetical protein
MIVPIPSAQKDAVATEIVTARTSNVLVPVHSNGVVPVAVNLDVPRQLLLPALGTVNVNERVKTHTTSPKSLGAVVIQGGPA